MSYSFISCCLASDCISTSPSFTYLNIDGKHIMIPPCSTNPIKATLSHPHSPVK